MRSRRFHYQDPASLLTLRQGLQEYFAGHSGLLKADSADIQTAKFFYSHDACHVLFGLDTTLPDEGLADLWTIFGTDIELARYTKFLHTNAAARQIVREVAARVERIGSSTWSRLLALRPDMFSLLRANSRQSFHNRAPGSRIRLDAYAIVDG